MVRSKTTNVLADDIRNIWLTVQYGFLNRIMKIIKAVAEMKKIFMSVLYSDT